LFHEWGNRAFGNKQSKTGQPIGEMSSENCIEDLFREYFGDALLSDSIKPTMVTTFDLTTGQPFFLNSNGTKDPVWTFFAWVIRAIVSSLRTIFLFLCLGAGLVVQVSKSDSRHS
jgi:hypothetical protein